MGIHYENLDEITREFMSRESALGNHYCSRRLTEEGLRQWVGLLDETIQHHNDDWLAQQLLQMGYLRTRESYTTKTGKDASRSINQPHAAQQLAESEFNRYYLRGLCCRSLELGSGHLVVYRGKEVRDPRPESDAKIGMRVDAALLLEALRSNEFESIEHYLAVPGGPNSGLTARLA